MAKALTKFHCLNDIEQFQWIARKYNRKQMSIQELVENGMQRATIERMVSDGELRKGSSGVWIPVAPDPGTMSVLKAVRSLEKEMFGDESL